MEPVAKQCKLLRQPQLPAHERGGPAEAGAPQQRRRRRRPGRQGDDDPHAAEKDRQPRRGQREADGGAQQAGREAHQLLQLRLFDAGQEGAEQHHCLGSFFYPCCFRLLLGDAQDGGRAHGHGHSLRSGAG